VEWEDEEVCAGRFLTFDREGGEGEGMDASEIDVTSLRGKGNDVR
jgi:hypothetical protein